MEKDEAREWTDNKLSSMENSISKIYRKSATGITKKWNTFMSESAEAVSSYQTAYDEAVASGDNDLISKTSKSLKDAITKQTLGNSYYSGMIDDVTTQLSNVNQTALSYVNGQMSSVYTKNFNSITQNTKSVLVSNGISFNLVSENVVKRRVTEGDITLPKKKVDVPKDKQWNTKQLNSSVLQGILQGESIEKISKRILPVVDNNETSAVRNARTMVTQAENQGRLDRYKDLESKGAIIKKVWMATGDSRTRDWHLTLDGQECDLDEDFIDGHGNHLEMPGDPSAPAETVYNCRCTTKSHILGFRKKDGSVSMIEYDYSQDEPSLHDQEIAKERSSRATASEAEVGNTRKVVNGTDISSTWTRRSDEFDFAIEDVINAQGFDGLPRVVSAEEFDRCVQEANDGNGFIAQRTYSAPDQETLDSYRDQLYNGEWYVDCSSGGAMHGRGMYCVANYGTSITDRMKSTMISYGGSEENSFVETFTLSKDAKIIKEDDIKNLLPNLGDSLVKKYVGKYNLSDEDLQFLSASSGIGHVEKVSELYSTNPQRATELMKMRSENKSLNDDMIEAYNEYLTISSDNGAVASLFGYDAIDCGRTQDYFVILNRTKVIFKESK